MGDSITNFGIGLALLTLLGCKDNSTCVPSYSGPDASNDLTCVSSYFFRTVTDPQDCYCSPCPYALPASQALANEQQYKCFCGDRATFMAAHGCSLNAACLRAAAVSACEPSAVDASQPEAPTQSAPDAAVNAVVIENDPLCPAPSSTLTSFRQPVTGPQDCYCLTCPVCLPSAQAFGYEQQYSGYCGLDWPAAHGCEAVACPPGASQ